MLPIAAVGVASDMNQWRNGLVSVNVCAVLCTMVAQFYLPCATVGRRLLKLCVKFMIIVQRAAFFMVIIDCIDIILRVALFGGRDLAVVLYIMKISKTSFVGVSISGVPIKYSVIAPTRVCAGDCQALAVVL